MRNKQSVSIKPAKDQFRDHLTVTSAWVTNGHWAIRRAYINNAHVLAADQTAYPDRYKCLPDDRVHPCLEMREGVDYTLFTGTSECRMLSNDKIGRIFVTDDGQKAMFDLEYLRKFRPCFDTDEMALSCHMQSPDMPGFFMNRAGEHVFTLMPMKM